MSDYLVRWEINVFDAADPHAAAIDAATQMLQNEPMKAFFEVFETGEHAKPLDPNKPVAVDLADDEDKSDNGLCSNCGADRGLEAQDDLCRDCASDDDGHAVSCHCWECRGDGFDAEPTFTEPED